MWCPIWSQKRFKRIRKLQIDDETEHCWFFFKWKENRICEIFVGFRYIVGSYISWLSWDQCTFVVWCCDSVELSMSNESHTWVSLIFYLLYLYHWSSKSMTFKSGIRQKLRKIFLFSNHSAIEIFLIYKKK
jgi:hypothetical protein